MNNNVSVTKISNGYLIAFSDYSNDDQFGLVGGGTYTQLFAATAEEVASAIVEFLNK